MKSATVVCLLFLSVSLSFSQPPDTLWTRTIFADRGGNANALCLTQDGDYIVVGSCCTYNVHSWTLYNGFISKYDRNGEQIWLSHDEATFWFCRINDVVEIANGNLILVGSYWSYGGESFSRIVAMCLTPNREWVWGYTNDEQVGGGNAVALTSDGGCLIAGYGDYPLTKLDSSGHLMWRHSWNMTLEDITPTPDGNFVCVGSYDTSASRCLIVKVTPDGDTLWTRDCNTGWDEQVHAVTTTFGGGLAICGTGNFPLGVDTFLGILDSSGNYLVRRAYEHEHSYAIDLCQLADSGFILVGGITPTYPNPRQTFVVRTAPNADAMWAKLWDEPFENFANSVLQDTDSGFVLVGKWGNDYWYISKLEYDLVDTDESPTAHIPESFSLTAFPNPFNLTTTISFSLHKSAPTRLTVYDLLGREVAVLKDGMLEAGEHRISFDGSDLPSGLYFARLQSGEFVTTQKLLLVK